jgi:hypothetical protein
MADSNLLREQARECRRLAEMAIDVEISHKLMTLADEYEAKVMQADAKGPANKT